MYSEYEHFCDYQIKRFLMQIVRAFSGFKYRIPRRGDKPERFPIVPCIPANRNRQVAAIKQKLSENITSTVPLITVDHTGMSFNEQMNNNPGHVGTVHTYLRKRDPRTGELTGEMGNPVSVDRLMPRPFMLNFQVDIWTSNQDQKHQLLEQILTMVYPTFDIQNSDNAVDWSALTNAHCKDLTWSSVSIPIGTDNPIDIATIQIEVPMWLNPPAKVKRMKVIETIVTNINDGNLNDQGELISGETLATEVTTPGNHCIEIKRGTITLLGAKGNAVNAEGDPFKWTDLFHTYSKPFIPAQTQLRIRTSLEDGAPEIVGRLQYGDDVNELEWQIDVDTLPSNTLAAVNAVIDPTQTFPGEGLPLAAEGQRYLLANDLPGNSQAWGMTGARAGAILQYQNGNWVVPFSGMPTEDVHYVFNQQTTGQLLWNGQTWTLAIDGRYAPGFWRII